MPDIYEPPKLADEVSIPLENYNDWNLPFAYTFNVQS